MIKLLILDVDGVLTTGHKTYDQKGNVISKEFYDKDFDYIGEIYEMGVDVVLMSGDKRVNEYIALERNLQFVYSRRKEKELTSLCNRYACTPEEVMFCGDSIHDLKLMKKVGVICCPVNACQEVKNLCQEQYITRSSGGNGVVEEIYHFLVSENSHG